MSCIKKTSKAINSSRENIKTNTTKKPSIKQNLKNKAVTSSTKNTPTKIISKRKSKVDSTDLTGKNMKTNIAEKPSIKDNLTNKTDILSTKSTSTDLLKSKKEKLPLKVQSSNKKCNEKTNSSSVIAQKPKKSSETLKKKNNNINTVEKKANTKKVTDTKMKVNKQNSEINKKVANNKKTLQQTQLRKSNENDKSKLVNKIKCVTGKCPFVSSQNQTSNGNVVKSNCDKIKSSSKRKYQTLSNDVNSSSTSKKKRTQSKTLSKTMNKTNTKNTNNRKNCDTDDDDDDDDDDEDDNEIDDSWLTYTDDGDDDDDDDDDDCCPGGICYPQSINKSAKKRTSGHNSASNNSKNCFSGNCPFTSKRYDNDDKDYTECNCKLQSDSCGYLWKETIIPAQKINKNKNELNEIPLSSLSNVDLKSEINFNSIFHLNDDNDDDDLDTCEEFLEDESEYEIDENNTSISTLNESESDSIDDIDKMFYSDDDDELNILNGEDRSTVNEDLNDIKVLEDDDYDENDDSIHGSEDQLMQFYESNFDGRKIDDVLNQICSINVNEKTNFKSKFYNSANSKYVIVLLKSEIYIQGTLKFCLIAGSAEIFGYKAKQNEILEIYSPRGYSHLSIKSIKNSKLADNEQKSLNIEDNLNTNLINEYDKKYIIKNWSNLYDYKTDAIVLLSKNDKNEIEMLKKYMKENVFIDIGTVLQKRLLSTTEILLQCILKEIDNNIININYNYDMIDKNRIIIDPEWNDIEVNDNSKILIIGGKNVGKSTLLRYLINKNLNKMKKILLIDLDIGQPEIFLPQTISATIIDKPLLGPGYFYSLKPDKSILYSVLNATLSPMYYVQIVKNLLDYCKKNNVYHNIPWLINTMGYNKGVGSELISIITNYLKPTDIIQIQSNRKINNYDYIMDFNTIKMISKNILIKNNDLDHSHKKYNKFNFDLLKNIHSMSNENLEITEELQQLKPHKLILLSSVADNIYGNLQKSSKFKNILARDKRYERMIIRCGNILNDENEFLTDTMPYMVSIEKINICSFENNTIPKHQLLDVVNGSFMYLCNETNEGYVECLGLGIVRGVNLLRKCLYIITSSKEILHKINKLVVCYLPLPSAILLNQGPLVQNIAPYIFATNNFIASRPVRHIYCKSIEEKNEKRLI